jgi:hypothetical protein
VRYFSASILPARLHSVRSLELTWFFKWPSYDPVSQRMLTSLLYPPYDESSWEACWSIVAGMKNLRRIRAWILESRHLDADDKEQKMLAPLFQVKHVPDFAVWFDWQLRTDLSEAPFRKGEKPAQYVLADSLFGRSET